MNILLFAKAPSNEVPKVASFVFARIKVLQELGHTVTVIQDGHIQIGISLPKSFSISEIRRFLTECYRFIFKRRNVSQIYERENIKYRYYNFIYFSSYKKFNDWFRKNNFDFIHAHFLWCCTLLPSIKKHCRIPFFVSAHGSDIHTNPFKSEKARIYALNILNATNGIFFVSDFLRRKACEFGWNGSNYIITGNGYFPENFFPKAQKNLNKNTVLLGFIGNPIKIKRFEILPKVLYLVKKEFPNTKLLCVGSTSKGNDLRNSVKPEILNLHLVDSFTFIDKVPYEEVGNYMRKIDILLLPSINEGFPCVALEAQACGTPVISSANGGIPEATGNIGLCVPESKNFIEDFAARIIQYINNPYQQERIISASIGRTWKNVVEKEISGYKKFLN